MKKFFLTAAAVLGMALTLTACGGNTDISKENETVNRQDSEPASDGNIPINNVPESEERAEAETEMKMNVQIGDYNFYRNIGE